MSPASPSPSRSGVPPILPYAIGAFMGLPFVLWIVLWLFVFPGEKSGFDSELTTVLLAVSAPLVLWFFFCSLGFIANSMAGANEFDRPRAPLITLTIAILPQATLCLGIAGGLYMLSLEAAWYAIAAPLALGVLIASSIYKGEQARHADNLTAQHAGFRGREPAHDRGFNAPRAHRLLWATLAGLAGLLLALQWTSDAGIVIAGVAVAAAVVFATLTVLAPEQDDITRHGGSAPGHP